METTFDTILLAVGPQDDDKIETLAESVLEVATPTDATVVLTHVFTPDQFQEITSDLGFPDATTEDVDAITKRLEAVRRLEERFDEGNVDYEIRGVVGDISDKLLTTAQEIGADRLVISGNSTTPVGKALFGSTAQDVLLNAPCPVTYVRPEGGSE